MKKIILNEYRQLVKQAKERLLAAEQEADRYRALHRHLLLAMRRATRRIR